MIFHGAAQSDARGNSERNWQACLNELPRSKLTGYQKIAM